MEYLLSILICILWWYHGHVCRQMLRDFRRSVDGVLPRLERQCCAAESEALALRQRLTSVLAEIEALKVRYEDLLESHIKISAEVKTSRYVG